MENQTILSRNSLVVLMLLLLGMTTINYIDRQVLSVLAPVIRDEFRLSNQQYAGILNAFMITYAVAMPMLGWIIDRIGITRGLTSSILLWSAAGILTSLSRGPLSLGFYRSILAVGESGAWPSFAKAVAAWVPEKWRIMGMGVCNSGSSMGSLIAPLLVVWISSFSGWQGAFIITGLLGICWVLIFRLFIYFHPQIRNTGNITNNPSASWASWKILLGYRQTWTVFICRFIADPIWYFYIFWIPEFLTRERGLSLTSMAAVAWIPFLVSDIANFTTGLFAQQLAQAGWSVNRIRKFLMIIGAAGTPIGVAAVFAHSLGWTMAFICIAIFFWMIWGITVLTLPGDFFPPRAVASVYGFGGMGSTIGSVISIWLVGHTLDAVHSYTPVFIGLGLLMPIVCIIGLILMGRVHRVELPVVENYS